MRVLIGLCKVDQYPVPLWCANTGAGFFAILSERFQDSVCSNRSKSSHFGSFQIRCGLARRMMEKAKSHAIYAAVRHFAKNQTEKLSRCFAGWWTFHHRIEKKSSNFRVLHGSELPARNLRAKRYSEIPADWCRTARKIGKCKRAEKFGYQSNESPCRSV